MDYDVTDIPPELWDDGKVGCVMTFIKTVPTSNKIWEIWRCLDCGRQQENIIRIEKKEGPE